MPASHDEFSGLSFSIAGDTSFGVCVGDGVVDLGRRTRGRYGSLRALLADGEAALEEARRLTTGDADYALRSVTFLPVVPDAAKLMIVGLNYRSHVGEAVGRAAPAFPRIFSRWNDSVVGHQQPIIRPVASTQFDYEGELAVIIGRPGRHIPAERAMEHVAGYTCFNDGSLRDWQKHSTSAGKNFHASASLGPWMVTADAVADPAGLTLITRVNGEQRQRADIGCLIYDIPTLIAYVSQFTPLAPGDIIATGTPEGVASYRTPPAWLIPGDVVDVEIPGIGLLRNPVVEEAR